MVETTEFASWKDFYAIIVSKV